MPIQEIDIGAAENDGTGDTVREAFNKTNQNFAVCVAPYDGDPAPGLNQVLKWNGTAWVPGDISSATEFSFACTAFGVTGKSTTELIGSGNWIAAGQAFTASWQLTPDSASVNVGVGGSGGFPVSMTSGSSYTASASNTVVVTYPSVGGSRVFTITGVKAGYSNATQTFTTTFQNKKWYGLSSVATPTDAQYRALEYGEFATTKTTAEVVLTLSGTPQYIHFVYPSRLGSPTLKINGFVTGFTELSAASFNNGNGYSEEFKKYRSPMAYTNATSSTLTFEVM